MFHPKRGGVLSVLGAAILTVVSTGLVVAEGPAISGYVDTQWGYNFDKPRTGSTGLRSYDSQDNNISNTTHLSLMGSFGEGIGYVIDLDAGHDANTTVGSVPASGVALQEAFVTYVGASKLGFKVGKFATYQGIEVIETNANPTISRGFLYNLAEPFTHVGGVATYSAGKLDFAAGLVNGWDQANDNNQAKTFVGKIGLNLGDTLAATLSGYHGPEQNQVTSGGIITDSRSGANRNSIDLTLLTKIIPKVDLFLQGNYGSEEEVVDLDGDTIFDDLATWSGFGIQPVIHFTDRCSLGARVEYFADNDGARTGTVDNFVHNITLTPGYKLTDNIQFRAELRQDFSNKKIWADDDATLEDTATTGAAQVIVTF